jgi:hypothetical protein
MVEREFLRRSQPDACVHRLLSASRRPGAERSGVQRGAPGTEAASDTLKRAIFIDASSLRPAERSGSDATRVSMLAPEPRAAPSQNRGRHESDKPNAVTTVVSLSDMARIRFCDASRPTFALRGRRRAKRGGNPTAGPLLGAPLERMVRRPPAKDHGFKRRHWQPSVHALARACFQGDEPLRCSSIRRTRLRCSAFCDVAYHPPPNTDTASRFRWRPIDRASETTVVWWIRLRWRGGARHSHL